VSVAEAKTQGGTAIRERVLEAAGAIGWVALVVGVTDALLFARKPGLDPTGLRSAATLHLALALVAALVTASLCIAAAGDGELRRQGRDAPSAAVSRWIGGLLSIGLLAAAAYAATRFNQVSFSSPLVRRVGINLSVGGIAVGLYAVHGRVSKYAGRLFGTQLRLSLRPRALTFSAIVMLALWLWLARNSAGAGAWRMAPVALFTMVGLLAAWQRPLHRLRLHAHYFAIALALLAACGWLVLLTLSIFGSG
jgi:hypothetical protein